MGAAREGASIWFYLFGKSKYCKPRDFFNRKLYKSPYFWQDSFWTPLNRLIGCRVLGHRNVIRILDDDNDYKPVDFCFNCYRKVSK